MKKNVYTKAYTTAGDIKNNDFLAVVVNNKIFNVQVESLTTNLDGSKVFNIKKEGLKAIEESYNCPVEVDLSGMEISAMSDRQVHLTVSVSKGIPVSAEFPMVFTNSTAADEALRDMCHKTLGRLAEKYSKRTLISK